MSASPVAPLIPDTTEEPLVPPMCAIFRRFLKRRGLKFTPERAQILDAVLRKPGIFEADVLFYEMRRAGHRVSKATIYRTLKYLMEANIVRKVLIDAKLSHYQLGFGREQQSHLVCMESNQITEFSAPELKEVMERICRQYGYEPVNYRFVVYGISPKAAELLAHLRA